MTKRNIMIYKLLFFFGGIYIIASGKVLLILSGFGVDPWTAFHLGIANHVPYTVGRVNQVFGIFMLLIGWILKIKPGLGTLANMYFFGFFLDLNLSLQIVKPPENLISAIIYFIFGIIINGIGFGIYLNAEMGAGPRDAFMLGISKTTGKAPGIIKVYIESAAVLIGWLLGGPVGIGTLIYAITVGPIMQWSLNHIKPPQKVKTEKTSKAEG